MLNSFILWCQEIITLLKVTFFFPDVTQRPQSSIDMVHKAKSNLRKTKCYEKILNQVQERGGVVLHCAGLPGSGKTQIIRQLVQEFPFSSDNDRLVVKWHICCKDDGHKITDMLKKLAEHLQKYHFIDENNCQVIKGHIDVNNSAKELVKVLYDSNASVVIVIEDLEEKDDLLRDFVRCLKIESQNLRSAKFHVYVTSRKRTSVISNEEIREIKKSEFPYIEETIDGFSKSEAVEYLCDSTISQDQKAAAEIYERFSGLPLAMQFVKRYCEQMIYKYQTYNEKVNADSVNVMPHENEAVTEEYKFDGSHLFHRIIMPLWKINGRQNSDSYLHWNFLACLSYLDYQSIPSLIFKHFYSTLHRDCAGSSSAKTVDVDYEVNRLINHLVEQSSCKRGDDGAMCFQKVVVNAFLISWQEQCKADRNQFDSLKRAHSMLSSLLKSKEAKDKQTLTKLVKHLECLQAHAKSDSSICKKEKKNISKALERARSA